ncbi:DUF3800 domain-containing protein [Microbacterium sp. UCD-TDU]|uniref:DUF3800 domain-containing protein n=1 Tax=Microbacterium sp. UCD-TDU TaxID=1247714 RepID=UPI001181A53D|nr:DUF3800 domain-containing protein [Microbacterium sp. UCD-TDU]
MNPPPSKPVRLIYVDDSGAERSGYATFSWLELRIDDWQVALREVLDWRHRLAREQQIPVIYELHATKFVNGRGDPSLDPSWNRHKAKRSLVVDDAFRMLAAAPWLSVGTVYSQTSLRGRAFADERSRVYGELVTRLDQRLTAAGELGILYMDGDGTDRSYVAAHRELKLATRSLIEDPAFQHSHSSHLVQFADLVAYAGYQHVLQLPEKRFAWPWYPSLSGVDVNGGPLAV